MTGVASRTKALETKAPVTSFQGLQKTAAHNPSIVPEHPVENWSVMRLSIPLGRLF